MRTPDDDELRWLEVNRAELAGTVYGDDLPPKSAPGDDLVAWLTQILDEQEALAKTAPGRDWVAFKQADVAGASVYDEQWVLLYPNHYDHDNPLSADPTATGPMYIEKARDELCAHIAANDPASVLARIAADRQILALHQPDRVPETWYWRERSCEECRHSWHSETPIGTPPSVIGPETGCPTVRLLALPYADRPGYQEAWKP